MSGGLTIAPTRLAVIGVGARSKLALHAVETGQGIVTAAVDPDPAARSRALTLFGSEIRTFERHEELIASEHIVDAAFVTSPDHTHAAIAVDLLNDGIPVYLEKPLAISVMDADAILHASEESGTPLYVGHNMRHMAVIRLMRDIIVRGEIGEVKAVWCRHFVGDGGDFYFKDWHAERSKSNGLLLQKGAHDIDVIHWLADGYSTLVTGMGALSVYGDVESRRDNSDKTMPDWYSRSVWPPLSQSDLNPVIDIEDLSMVLMHLDNGVLASYEQCHFTPDYWRNYTVIGTEGRLENFGDTDGGVVKVWNQRSGYNSDGDAQFPISGDEFGHNDADKDTVLEFLGFVQHGSATATSPLAARNAVATAVAATESLRSGSTPVRVAPFVSREGAH